MRRTYIRGCAKVIVSKRAARCYEVARFIGARSLLALHVDTVASLSHALTIRDGWLKDYGTRS